MQQQKEPDLTLAQSVTLTGNLASALALPTEAFLSYGDGKRYLRSRITGAAVVMAGFIVMFPTHGVLTSYAILWSMVVCLRIILAQWKHSFGQREDTRFCGYPVLNLIFPFWLDLTRRFLNPLLTFGLGVLVEDRALALLFKSSAIGQFIFFSLVYAVAQSDDDARSDAQIRRY